MAGSTLRDTAVVYGMEQSERVCEEVFMLTRQRTAPQAAGGGGYLQPVGLIRLSTRSA